VLILPLYAGVDYSSEIQPIFNSRCTNCHSGSDAEEDLSLTSYNNVMNGGDSGDVVIPYDHANSLLWEYVNSGFMPPYGSGNDILTTDQINLIAQWIDEGALFEPEEDPLGDLNGDGMIDILDIILLVNIILADEYNSIADLNEDGELNILDVVIMVNLVLYGDDGACIDIDGNVYETIQIGEQEWMAENLKVTQYNNGDPITHVTNNGDWGSYDEGQYGVYDNDPSYAVTYGNLYNWAVVDDSRGVCPEGWHVPSDDEWKELEMAVGMSQSEADDTGHRGTNEASKLAGNAVLWNEGDLKDNARFGVSGFNALPSGYHVTSNNAGGYYGIGSLAYFWSSSDFIYYDSYSGNDIIVVWTRSLSNDNASVFRFYDVRQHGFSLRCVAN